MGWASGSELATDIWKDIKPYIKEENLKQASKSIYQTFNAMDADDWCWQATQKGELFYDYLKLNYPKVWQKIQDDEDWELEEIDE